MRTQREKTPVFFTVVKYAENKIRRNHFGCAVSVPMCATAPAASLHSLAVVRNGNSVRITRSLPPPTPPPLLLDVGALTWDPGDRRARTRIF